VEIREVYEEQLEGNFVHINWCLYRDDFNCIQESLAFADFVKTVRRRALKTVFGKMTALKYWHEYLELIGKDIRDYITLQEQTKFGEFLAAKENRHKLKPLYVSGQNKYERGFSAKTVNRHQADIKEYYVFLKNYEYTKLAHEELPFRNPSLSRIKEEKVLPKVMTMPEVRMLISACTTLRDKLIVIMLVTMGLRVGELCSLTLKIIDYSNGTFNMLEREYLDLETGTLKTGPRNLKGNKVLFSLLQKYFLLERDACEHCDNILVTLASTAGQTAGSPLSQGAVKALFKRLKARTGIRNCHPHTLRHTFATNFLRLRKKNDKITLAQLQKLLGHKNLNTTLIYTHLDYTDLDIAVGTTFEDFVAESIGTVLEGI